MQFIQELLDSILENLQGTLLSIVLAILIFIFGFLLGKLLQRVIYKALSEVELNKFIKRATGFSVNADNLISTAVSYIVYFLALVAALDQIGVASIVLYLLAGAALIVLLLSLFLALRDFIPNLIAGIYLYSKLQVRKGTKIEIENIKGEVVKIDLFQIKVKTKKGDILFIPNSKVATSLVKLTQA